MKWLKITVWFFLVTLVKCGPTRSEEDLESEPEPEPVPQLTIDSMVRNSPEKLTFTLTKETPLGTSQTVLVIKNQTGIETDYEADEKNPSETFTFKDDLKDLSGQENVGFLLTATDGKGEQLAFAQKDIGKFPDFPDTLTAKKLDGPRNPGKDVISRVEGNLGTMNLDKAGTLITEKGNIHYYQEKADSDYTPCTEINSVTICDVTLVPDDLTKSTSHVDILKSAVLSYGTDNKAIVKLSPIAPSADILDAILIPPPSNANILCDKGQIEKGTCAIDWKGPSEDTLQMVIVQKTTEARSNKETWTTTTIDIHDRKLVVNQLGTNIIEGRWKMLKDESFYRMELNGGDNQVDIDVDCSHLSFDPKLCFGYFSDLAKDKTYTLTVAYKEDEKYNEKDQIESSPVKITSLEPELAILSRHMTRHANQLTADVNICFQHLTPQEGGAFSHYEMLIINEKGQWLKHRILEEEEGEEGEEEEANKGRLCFAPFTINTKDFDLTEGTKVLISQRAVDGVTVLASGESKLL